MKPNYGKGKILKDLEEVNNLKCMIEEPTRITTNSETLLDVILTNAPKMFKKCGTYEPEISDHRQTKKTDFEKLNRDSIDAPWHVGDIFSNSDEKYDYWRALFESIVDKHAPMKKKRVREKDIPYMTAEWKQAIRNKRKYAVLFAKNRTVENLELKKKYRNIATQERRNAIKAYWHKKSEELQSRPNKFFKAFRPFISTKTKDSN